MLWAAATAAAQPHDAGPADAAEPPDDLARLADRNAQLGQAATELEAVAVELDAVPDDEITPSQRLHARLNVDPTDLAAVAARIDAIEREFEALEHEIANRTSIVRALERQWSDGGDAGVLDQLRLEQARLGLRYVRAELALAEAAQRYLARTQPARVRAYDTDHAREEAADAQDAEVKRRAHEQARTKALAERDRAATEADKIISSEEARLAAIGKEQADYQDRLRADRNTLGSLITSAKEFHDELELLPYDEQYDAVELRLRRVRVNAIEDTLALFSTPKIPGEGEALSEAVRVLPSTFESRVAPLQARLRELHIEGEHLKTRARQVLADRAAFYVRQADELNAILIDLLGRISAAKRSRLTWFTSHALAALRGEATQVAVDVSYWTHTRWHQLRGLAHMSDRWGDTWAILLKIFEILFLLLILRFVLRRWDAWMLAIVDALGGSVAVGGTTLWLARLADAARHFGPSLLALVTAIVAYHRLGSGGAPPEIQVVYVFAFWMTLLRFQLRVAERVAAAIRLRAAERARVRAEEEHDAAEAEGDLDPAKQATNITAERPAVDAGEPEEAASLFSKTWRVGTAYVAVFAILRALTELAVGRGVFFTFATRFAWWGSVPLAVYFLRAWRPRIVHEYVQWSPKAGPLTGVAETHAHRFYGVFIVALVFIVVVVRRTGRFVKQHLMNLEWIRAFRAFWTRSRVEKHGRHGRVLENPPDLPPDIIKAFPVGPIGPDDRPVKTAPLETIKEMFESWKRDKSDGSAVLVGESGMGKSTVLAQLQTELGEEVMEGTLLTKITRAENLAATIARILGLPGADDVRSERELVSAIYDEKRRIIALDNCHNLFLRKVGGFEAWEAFTRIVNETCDNVFWVLAFNDTSWEYLNDVAERVSYFRRVIHMPPWTDEQIRRLILTRMRRARYRPNFTNLLVTRLEGVKTSTQIIRTSKGYFRLLWDFTDGNPRLATHFWMRSLVPEEDKRRASVHLFAAPKVEDLEQLPDDLAFVLTAVIEHENITPAELAETSNMTVEFCRFALRLCRERGYLWRNPTTGRMALSTHWQKTIVRYLTRKGFLYT